MPLVAFELVKKVLHMREAEALAVHGKGLDGIVGQTHAALAAKYSQLSWSKKPIIDYSDPATHLAYLFGYVPAHACFLTKILNEARMLDGKPLFSDETLRVTSVGGGPGSDLIGLLKYLLLKPGREPTKHVRIRILDKEPAWADVCNSVLAAYKFGISVELEFVELDVTDEGSFASIDWSNEDLIAMSFFVSEVSCLDDTKAVKRFFSQAFKEAQAGCLIAYNDNKDPSFRGFFDERLAKAGAFTVLTSEDAADLRLDASEEASVLDNFKKRFGGRSTRLTGKTSYRVVRKK